MPKQYPILVSLTFATMLWCIWLWTFTATARPVADQQEWQPLKELPQPLASHGVVIIDNYLYLVGGKSVEDKPLANVCSIKILDKDVLEPCKALPALPYPLYLHATVASSKYLYALGGWDGTNWHKEVWRAAILDNGNIGAWVPDRDLMDNRRLALHEAVLVDNRYLYVLGGQDDARKIQKQVFYAAITPDGALGEWKPATDLPNPLYRFSAVAKDNTLYVTGGYDGKVSRGEIYYTTIDSNTGEMKSGWLLAPNKFLPGRHYHKAVIFDQKLLIIGGRSDQQELSSLVAAPFDAQNVPGAWQMLPGLVESLHRFAAINQDDQQKTAERLYILGGLHGTDYRKTIYQLVAPTPALTLTVTPVAVNGSDRLLYTIIMRSHYTLSNVMVRNSLPDNVRIVPDTIQPSHGVVNTGAVTEGTRVLQWHLQSNLLPDSSITIAYQVEYTLPLTNNTKISVINQGAVAAWSYLGYGDSMSSKPVRALLPFAPRLTMTSEVGKDVDNVTSVLTFTIDYKNGTYSLTNLSLVNTIPASVTAISESFGCVPTCLSLPMAETKPGQEVRWGIPDLLPDASGKVFYRVQRLPLSTSDALIKNQGAQIDWHYQGSSGVYLSDPLSTTFPYVANFILQNEPRGEISQTEKITYTITFKSDLATLRDITVTSQIPTYTQLVSNSIRSSTGVSLVEQESGIGQLLGWTVNEIRQDKAITMSYSVSRITNAPNLNGITDIPPILNEGAIISWTYVDESNIVFRAGARSNSSRNPPLYQFLPFVPNSILP